MLCGEYVNKLHSFDHECIDSFWFLVARYTVSSLTRRLFVKKEKLFFISFFALFLPDRIVKSITQNERALMLEKKKKRKTRNFRWFPKMFNAKKMIGRQIKIRSIKLQIVRICKRVERWKHRIER